MNAGHTKGAYSTPQAANTKGGKSILEIPAGVEFLVLGRWPTNRLIVKVRYSGRELWIDSSSHVTQMRGECSKLPTLPPPTLARGAAGVNLDIYHPQGKPDATQLAGKIGWVRLNFNVSLNDDYNGQDTRRYGNEDIERVFDIYKPYLEKYKRAGVKVILILTHQTYGEGYAHDNAANGYSTEGVPDKYDWKAMDDAQWQAFAEKFAAFAGRVAAKFAGKNLVDVYQIWNEQDAGPKAKASIPLRSSVYGKLLNKTLPAIRKQDGTVEIITGGHNSGPGNGAQYMREAFEEMASGVRPDGIAFHPYGRGLKKDEKRFAPVGPISESVDIYEKVLPGKSVWITEWGILDIQDQNDEATLRKATQYVNEVFGVLAYFGNTLACAAWYAWAEGMDTGYGLADSSGNKRDPLYSAFMR